MHSTIFGRTSIDLSDCHVLLFIKMVFFLGIIFRKRIKIEKVEGKGSKGIVCVFIDLFSIKVNQNDAQDGSELKTLVHLK